MKKIFSLCYVAGMLFAGIYFGFLGIQDTIGKLSTNNSIQEYRVTEWRRNYRHLFLEFEKFAAETKEKITGRNMAQEYQERINKKLITFPPTGKTLTAYKGYVLEVEVGEPDANDTRWYSVYVYKYPSELARLVANTNQ